MSLKVTISAFDYIPFRGRRYDGMGVIDFHGDKFSWQCAAFETETKRISVEVTLTNVAGRLTEDQVEVVSAMAADTIECMVVKGGAVQAGKVMDYGRKDWNGNAGFDKLPNS